MCLQAWQPEAQVQEAYYACTMALKREFFGCLQVHRNKHVTTQDEHK